LNLIHDLILANVAYLIKSYKSKIDLGLELNESFVVGDARGADALAQKYLLGKT